MRATLRQLRDRRSKAAGVVRALIRRMAIVAHDGAEWVLSGYEDADGNAETEVAEPFGVAGVYSRPAGGNAQAIVVQVGAGGGHAVIVATRDRDLLALLDGGIAAGETGMCNQVVALRLLPGGTVEISTHGGAGVALATAAEVEALRRAIRDAVNGDAIPAAVADDTLGAITGTSVLRGE